MIMERTRVSLTELKTQLSSASPQRRADQTETRDEPSFVPRRRADQRGARDEPLRMRRWLILGAVAGLTVPALGLSLVATAATTAYTIVSAGVSAAVIAVAPAAAGTGAATVVGAVAGTGAGAVAGAVVAGAVADVDAAANAAANAAEAAAAAAAADEAGGGDARGNGAFEAGDEEPATDRLDGYKINEVLQAFDKCRKESRELKTKEGALGEYAADFAVFCRKHIHSVVSSKLAGDEFRFLLDILRGTRSHGVPVTTLLDEEEIIHSRVTTLLERLQRSASNQEALTITEQILAELHESPNDEEIERRIKNFIETKFAEACKSQL